MADDLTMDVAIVGGGPAGLAAAMALREAGVARVVVLEREAEAGGVPRHCGHPAFGLREFGRVLSGPAYARRLVRRARQAGVDIRCGHSVVALKPGGAMTIASPEGLLEVLARRVVIATGARETPRSARLVSGDRPLGILNTGALQDYVYLRDRRPFAAPVIVGTELVGLSAVWTCVAHGIRPVAVIEKAPRGVARWPLTLFPHLLRIPVHYGSEIVDIAGRGRVSEVTIKGPQGTRQIACDGVLLTGKFRPESSLAGLGGLSIDLGTNGPVVDQLGRCSDPAYVATGNLLRGIETAGWCYREGRKTGWMVAKLLAGVEPPPASVPVIAQAPLRYVMPQRLVPDEASVLQIRLDGPVRGRLRATLDGVVVAEKRINSRPERRVLLEIPGLSSGHPRPLEVSLDEDA